MSGAPREVTPENAELRMLLDQVAADGWPPVERVDVGGWRLRAADGVTRRANSALPSGGVPVALDARLDAVRAFYAERGLQVTQENLRAQQVYAAAGLAPSYGYSYRTPPPQEVPPP